MFRPPTASAEAIAVAQALLQCEGGMNDESLWPTEVIGYPLLDPNRFKVEVIFSCLQFVEGSRLWHLNVISPFHLTILDPTHDKRRGFDL